MKEMTSLGTLLGIWLRTSLGTPLGTSLDTTDGIDEGDLLCWLNDSDEGTRTLLRMSLGPFLGTPLIPPHATFLVKYDLGEGKSLGTSLGTSIGTLIIASLFIRHLIKRMDPTSSTRSTLSSCPSIESGQPPKHAIATLAPALVGSQRLLHQRLGSGVSGLEGPFHVQIDGPLLVRHALVPGRSRQTKVNED